MLYHCKNPEKPTVLLLSPTGILAASIGGTIIHSGLDIKTRIRLRGLNDKSKAALRNKLLEMKFLIIDKLSMVSTGSWVDIISRLQEIFMMIIEKAFAGMMIIEKAFAGLSVRTVGDFL